MDDDEFGGFEAAETFDGGTGETPTTSPAIPWAAFPSVPVLGVQVSPSASPDVPEEQCLPSSSLLSSNSFTSSSDDSPSRPQLADRIGNPGALKDQVQLSTKTPPALPEEQSCETARVKDDATELEAGGSNLQFQHKVTSLEIQLKASEEENQRIKKDLEKLMEKYKFFESDFLKDKENEVLTCQNRYKELQDKHKHELEDMRKAGHEALSIIVEEYKALLQSTVRQQEEAIEKQYVATIEKQVHKCEDLLNTQHQRFLEILDSEKELLKDKIQEALVQQSQEQKAILEKYLEEERERSKEALSSAVKIEKEIMKSTVLQAVEEERRNLKKVHAEERESWKSEHTKDQDAISRAIQEAIQEQRKISQETVKAEIAEERRRSENAVEEAVKRTREELMEYVKEQKRLDQITRQRSLSSLELFLSCAQKQLHSLISAEQVSPAQKEEDIPDPQ
ncbi:coiled-coil domain-containing protein 91 isoform X1 [Tachyglossus aculeatus]|uniref:coiled-coil domain-containing protein 91 isoform X1 n=1 Tax=Tachyglossus aculeatus TaxID=9261 RepID=UPI0018F77582|nr:coiled-coil domain-containing protein 91 isoform X1 [Tachyglossus aculeatus]